MSAVFNPTRTKIDVGRFHKMVEAGILGQDDRIELIDGEMLDMPPIGGPHNYATVFLANRIQEALGSQYPIVAQGPVHLSEYNEPLPDIMVLRPPMTNYRKTLPRADDVMLLIEVSDTTLVYDRDIKLPLYARYGIVEVWIVDLNGARLEIHRDPRPRGYGSRRILERAEPATPLAWPDLQFAWGEALG